MYKEALTAATNEVGKSKPNSEHKLAQNIKSDSKSFYAYVRSKQNVRDKVGSLENNAGNGRGIKYALEFSVHERRYLFVICTRNNVQWIRGDRTG